MKKTALFLAFLFTFFPASGQAFSSSEDFFSSYQNQPAWFEVAEDGSAKGETVGGEYFTQVNISNDRGLKLQKFSIGKAFFYVSDKGLIKANSDLSAVSIYFTLA